jgi:hypothetical protein
MQILDDPVIRYGLMAGLVAAVLIVVFRINSARIKRNKLDVELHFGRHDKD